jgi:D-alanine--D-alanine ligase
MKLGSGFSVTDDGRTDERGRSERVIVLLCNLDDYVVGGSPHDAMAAQSHRATVDAVAAALASLGPVVRVETGDGNPERLARELMAHDPRLVFNLAEGARGRASLEACIAAMIELLDIPFTGNSARTLALCLDKPMTRALLRGAGLPVPDGWVLRDPARDPLDGVRYPAIVKPACLDASHGIEPENVVAGEAAARATAARLIALFGAPVLIEHFLDGREIAASLMQLAPDAAPVLLPLSEIDWQGPAEMPRVVGFRAKWIEDSSEFGATPVVCPAPVAQPLQRRIEDVCRGVFTAVGGRDYLRIDLRLDRDERVFIIDVNPNPSIAPDAGFVRSAAAAGWTYDALIDRIARNASSRGSRA